MSELHVNKKLLVPWSCSQVADGNTVSVSLEFRWATVCFHFSAIIFLKLKLATECHSLFFNVFIAAGKVSLPHMKRTSNLHDLFLILCSQNVLHRWNFECFEWSVFGLTWSTYRCCLLPISCTCPLLFFFFVLAQINMCVFLYVLWKHAFLKLLFSTSIFLNKQNRCISWIFNEK